jgi:hypothetical protein
VLHARREIRTAFFGRCIKFSAGMIHKHKNPRHQGRPEDNGHNHEPHAPQRAFTRGFVGAKRRRRRLRLHTTPKNCTNKNNVHPSTILSALRIATSGQLKYSPDLPMGKKILRMSVNPVLLPSKCDAAEKFVLTARSLSDKLCRIMFFQYLF